MNAKDKYISLIQEEFRKVEGTIYFELNNDKARLLIENDLILVMDYFNESFPIEELDIKNIMNICYELNIEPREDYIIIRDNIFIGNYTFKTLPEINCIIEILFDDNIDQNLTVFSANKIKSFKL